jgi:prepilin-type N-terminal cleavage/methylation domain-containing protein/prepilin-type processing-associated H-X9-DG protein
MNLESLAIRKQTASNQELLTRMKPSGSKHKAFTLTELLVVIAIVALFSVMLVPAFAKTYGQKRRLDCVNNLKQIGLAFHLWAANHQYLYPMSVSGDPTIPNNAGSGGAMNSLSYNPPRTYGVFMVMSNELTSPKVVVCPSDNRTARTNFSNTAGNFDFNSGYTAVSYFVGLSIDETMPQAFLAGDRNIGTRANTNSPYALIGGGQDGVVVAVATNAPIGWTDSMHTGKGNITLVDGSVQQLSSSTLIQASQNSGAGTNFLAFPSQR